MRIILSFVLALLMISCTNRNTAFTIEEGRDTLDVLGYALVDTDDDRYIFYTEEEITVDEKGAEDIRMISTSYDRTRDQDVVIRSTTSHISSLRVDKVVQLLRAFGVSDEDITQSDIREELQPYEDIIQISVRAQSDDIAYFGR